MKKVSTEALKFKHNYPWTVAWRIRQNASVIERHLNPDEKIIYVFAGQKNNNIFDIFGTAVIALTTRRILIGRKRVVFGYFLDAVTPDLFNDLKVRTGLFWGKIFIDTAKEKIVISNIQKTALPEIETAITDYMMKEKRKMRTTSSK